MNSRTIKIIDRYNNQTIEVIQNARIPDRMRIRREYQGLEHDGRYAVKEETLRFDALGFPK